MSREMGREMGRETFLHGPPAGWLDPLSDELKARIQEAENAVDIARRRRRHPAELAMLNFMEAQASAWIEGEHDPARIERHALALGKFLAHPAGEKSLLRMHQGMMRGQPHAQPGGYRSISVMVGNHRPPPPGLVPSLMDELFSFISGQPASVPAAVWAHVHFETIHPFADGNGRTGRAVLQAVLGAPTPVSRFILRERQTYYELFRRSDWPAWLEWLCRGILEESPEKELLPDPLSSGEQDP